MIPTTPAPGRPVVFIIDDDSAIRTALKDLLESVGLESRSFASVRDFLASDRGDEPGCLVLDVRMPDQSGLEFQREMTALGIRLPVIFITGHGDIPMSVSAMKAGAIEFLAKPFRDQELLDAIQLGVDRDRRRRREELVLGELRRRFDTLTARERQVMGLVVKGLLNKQAAGELGVSEVTVKVCRGQAMRKMEADSLADLVRMADRLAAEGEDGLGS